MGGTAFFFFPQGRPLTHPPSTPIIPSPLAAHIPFPSPPAHTRTHTHTHRGRLVYVDKDHGHPNTCSPSDCRYACSSYAAADPPFRVDPSGGGKSGAGPVGPDNAIMLVDRGPMDSDSAPCKFAEKVWNAQQAGAAGVLVVNFEDKHTTMEAPDDQDEVCCVGWC